MSEGSGRAAKLRRTLNARMEEMSFRAGIVAFAAIVALTAAAVTLAVMLGGSGHRAGVALPAQPSASFSGSVPGASPADALPSSSAGPSAAPGSPAYGTVPQVTDAPSPGRTTQPGSGPASPVPSPSPSYRPMGLAPSHSITSPAPRHPVSPPPGWLPP